MLLQRGVQRGSGNSRPSTSSRTSSPTPSPAFGPSSAVSSSTSQLWTSFSPAPKAVTIGFQESKQDTGFRQSLEGPTTLPAVPLHEAVPVSVDTSLLFATASVQLPPKPVAAARGLLSRALNNSRELVGNFSPEPGHNLDAVAAIGSAYFPDVDLSPLQVLQTAHPVFANEVVVTAYCLAARAHSSQLRKDGSPLISHCLDVAKTLASIGLDAESIAAGLVHEVLCSSSLHQSQVEEFLPSSIVALSMRVRTITEMSRIYRRHREDFTDAKFQGMLVAMEDVKAVLIKLADRVHDLRTASCLPQATQEMLAQESLDVYSVVANRLGVWGLKAEMEDLALKVLRPAEYEAIASAVRDRQDPQALEATMARIKEAMQAHGVQVEDISGRPKNIYGIWSKLRKDGHNDISRIFDVTALRVVVSNKHECYVALRALQSVYRCMKERSKDFIRNIRKPNGYQSLHETVLGEGGRPMEVQIRTHKMHYIAEYGFAAHWKYKESLNSDEEWLEKETQYKRWLTQHKLGLLDRKVRPHGVSPQDTALRSLGVQHLDRVNSAPEAVDPFLRHDRFKLQVPVKSQVSVLVHAEDSVDTRTFPAGTTAEQLWSELGVNDQPGYTLTVNSMTPNKHNTLRNGDLVQVLPLSEVLSRSASLMSETTVASMPISMPSLSSGAGSSGPLASSLPLSAAFSSSPLHGLKDGMLQQSFGRAPVVFGRGPVAAGPTRAVRVGGF